MAYVTFTSAAIGAPVMVVTGTKFSPTLGTVAPWYVSGQTGHRQPLIPTASNTAPPLINQTPPTLVMPTTGAFVADGNYKTPQNRGPYRLYSPPTEGG